ncbi:MAG: hypothetical protein ACD_43C00118G0006 [uncultured bacterium]|nr:MAG: hypothetical protein ACD_43C00118G0006 [uncultured bacterium]
MVVLVLSITGSFVTGLLALSITRRAKSSGVCNNEAVVGTTTASRGIGCGFGSSLFGIVFSVISSSPTGVTNVSVGDSAMSSGASNTRSSGSVTTASATSATGSRLRDSSVDTTVG